MWILYVSPGITHVVYGSSMCCGGLLPCSDNHIIVYTCMVAPLSVVVVVRLGLIVLYEPYELLVLAFAQTFSQEISDELSSGYIVKADDTSLY